jgi:PAS domain S-box-containing protein
MPDQDVHARLAQDAHTRSNVPGHPATSPPSIAAFVLARGLNAQQQSLRLMVGFGLLLVLGVAALNTTLWHNISEQIEEEAWRRLEVATDSRSSDIDHVLEVFRREAVSVAGDPDIVLALGAVSTRTPDGVRAGLLDELYSRADAFEFRNVVVLAPDGQVLAQRRSVSAGQAELDQQAVREVVRTGQPAWVCPHGGQLALAVPVGHSSPLGRVLVMHADAGRTLRSMVRQLPGLDASSGAYLVTAAGDSVEVLTDHARTSGIASGQHLAMSRKEAVAAAMAATHIASRVELPGRGGVATWAVTRPLSGANWGLVSQVERAEMLSGLSSLRQTLLVLDLILLGLFLPIAFVWRRSYTSGLARREAEITDRHVRRAQAILDTAFDAIFTFDRVGRVRTANRAAEAMVGRAASEIENRPIQDVLSWGAPGKTVALSQSGTVVAGQAVRPDGERVPVEFSLGRSGEGEDLMHTAIVRDVRERVEAERRIREFAEGLAGSNRSLEEMNAQLEEASKLKSEFLANTSHELRTPLNGMIGFLQLVLDGMCDSREEEVEFLKLALQCSRSLLGLINDVLDIAKIEAGKLTLDLQKLDVQAVFDEVYTVTHVQAAQKGLKLCFENAGELAPSPRGDFGKVKQVLINLIGNSLKFTAKGEIRVRAKAHPDLGHLLFEVEDTGIGIPVSRQKMVFDKFVQADGSTTRRFGGTGLGLAISKSLVELMGGIIGIHSEGENLGTRVYFALPLWRDDSTEPVTTIDAAVERIEGVAGDPLVLVVEDDPVFRRFVTAVLQRGGYRTVEADHAEAAWTLVRRLRPAVVLLDYALSCQDGATMRTGWDLAQRMTGEEDTRHIPVVFVTGFDGELKQRLQATAFARRPEHLMKPVDPTTLIAKVTELAGEPRDRIVRVLMADDDLTVSAYVRKVLPADRFLVDVANNGEECLHALRTQPNTYDVLLLDLMMPEVSGYDVLREMTLAGLYPDLPIMVLTNFPEPRNAEEARLLEQGLVLDVVAKTAVHSDPQLLSRVLDWHLQIARGEAGDDPGSTDRRAA